MKHEAEVWFDDHLDQYIDILTQVVAIPSVAVPNAEGFPFGRPCWDMLHFMQNLFSKAGLEVDLVDDQVLIGTLPGLHDTGKSIGIACHGDVVPAEGIWLNNPFSLVHNGDWLTGRGATDNKGATIAVLFALLYLKDHHRLHNDVRLYVGSAEEIGMDDMRYLLSKRPRPSFTLVPDAGFPVCHGEKGNLKIEASATLGTTSLLSITGGESGASVADHATARLRGTISTCNRLNQLEGIHAIMDQDELVVTAHGIGRHTAMPDGGVDAIGLLARSLVLADAVTKDDHKLLSFIGKITQDFHGASIGIPLEDPEFGKISHVLTVIRKVEDTITIRLNIRFPRQTTSQQLLASLGTLLGSHGFSIDSFTASEPTYIPMNPMLQSLNDIANAAYGTNASPFVMSGGTYARLLQPAIAYGMGSPNGNIDPPFPPGQGRAHQSNESVHIPRMRKGMRIYVEALMEIDRWLSEGTTT